MVNSTLHQAEIYRKIDEALATIRPYLNTDGGDVKVLELTEQMVLKVELLGNCRSCVMSPMTLKTGVEEAVLSAIPEIKAVEAVILSDLDGLSGQLPVN